MTEKLCLHCGRLIRHSDRAYVTAGGNYHWECTGPPLNAGGSDWFAPRNNDLPLATGVYQKCNPAGGHDPAWIVLGGGGGGGPPVDGPSYGTNGKPKWDGL